MRLAHTGLLLLAAMLIGCDRSPSRPAPSPRIVTLAPHITIIAFDLGVGAHVVGIDTYSEPVLPAGEQRTVVSDASRPNTEALLAVEPDILFYNQRDSDFEPLQRLRPSVRLYRLRNDTIEDVRASVRTMGEAMGRADLAQTLLETIDRQLDAVRESTAARSPRPRVLFLVGTEKPGTAGAGTYIDELISLAGGVNAAAENDEARLEGWPELNAEAVLRLEPEVLVVWAGDDTAGRDEARRYWQDQAQRAGRPVRVEVTSHPALIMAGSHIGLAAQEMDRLIHAGIPGAEE